MQRETKTSQVHWKLRSDPKVDCPPISTLNVKDIILYKVDEAVHAEETSKSEELSTYKDYLWSLDPSNILLCLASALLLVTLLALTSQLTFFTSLKTAFFAQSSTSSLLDSVYDTLKHDLLSGKERQLT